MKKKYSFKKCETSNRNHGQFILNFECEKQKYEFLT